MEAAVKAQLAQLRQPPQKVQVLILDKCSAAKVTGLEGFVELTKLSINGAGLTTLDNFPHLPKLSKVPFQVSDKY